jgi:hypothetical protein
VGLGHPGLGHLGLGHASVGLQAWASAGNSAKSGSDGQQRGRVSCTVQQGATGYSGCAVPHIV